MKFEKCSATDKKVTINDNHDTCGEVRNGAADIEELQAITTQTQERVLKTDLLMERVVSQNNLQNAVKRVMANKGAPGIDDMRTTELPVWMKVNEEELITQLLTGIYQPMAVKRVTIPKPGGGTRDLGIPTVVDRMVQQAVLQLLNEIIDPTFSESSYGFRPGKSAHQALEKASVYVQEGYEIGAVGPSKFSQISWIQNLNEWRTFDCKAESEAI